MSARPLLVAVVFVAVLFGAIALTIRARMRRGAPLLVAVGGFSDEPAIEVDREPFWEIIRLIIGALVLAFGVASLITFHQRATLEQLYADAGAHRVHDVTLSPGLAPGATGAVERQITWRSGLSRWEVTIEQEHGDGVSFSSSGSDPVEPTFDDVEAKLRGLDPGVDLHISAEFSPGDSSLASRLGLSGVAGTVATVLFLVAAVLLLSTVIGGPETWRASRWAWFWFLGSPLGWLAFCLFSGPTPAVPTPARNRRMTGGVAFALSLVVTPLSKGLLPYLMRHVLPGHS